MNYTLHSWWKKFHFYSKALCMMKVWCTLFRFEILYPLQIEKKIYEKQKYSMNFIYYICAFVRKKNQNKIELAMYKAMYTLLNDLLFSI